MQKGLEKPSRKNHSPGRTAGLSVSGPGLPHRAWDSPGQSISGPPEQLPRDPKPWGGPRAQSSLLHGAGNLGCAPTGSGEATVPKP